MSVITGELSSVSILAIETGILAFVTFANLLGLRFSGVIETFLICLKTIPLVLLPAIFFTYFDPELFQLHSQAANTTEGFVSTISATALLTFWGFIGVECGTTPAGSIKNPTRTLPKAIMIGTIIVALIYIMNILAVVGVTGFDALVNTTAPYSLVMTKVFGGGYDIVISILVIVVCMGTLNSWTLSSSQAAYGAYTEGLFPRAFGRVNKFGAPVIALFVASIGMLPFLILEQLEHGGLDKLINLVVGIFLYVYLFCAIAYLKLIKKWYTRKADLFKKRILASVAGLVCIFVLAQDIVTSIIVLAIFLGLGIPVYKRAQARSDQQMPG
jgi:APA family basic amino acid/polyamine antiporter